VFVPISLGDVLTYTGVLLKPAQGSGPRPVELQQAGLTLARLSSIVGRETASKLLQTSQATNLGGQQSVFQSLLSQPAFRALTPPPASSKLLGMDKGADSVRGVVRGKAGRDYQLDLAHYVGPFPLWNCEWVLQEELVPILEVPDITFWVTQDIDGDGEQETIYSDGWFQIGWKSGPINDVTLHASPIARINGTCEAPPVGDCEQPEITFAGLMPATSAYIDTTNDANRGTSVRVNPPHADGTIRPSVFPPTIPNDEPAAAPFTGTVQLYGCTTFAGGEFYRLLYSYNKAALTPFTGVTWYLDPNPGPGLPVLVSPDAQGWYPILASPDAWWPPNELLDWPTTSYPDGLRRHASDRRCVEDHYLYVGDGGSVPCRQFGTAAVDSQPIVARSARRPVEHVPLAHLPDRVPRRRSGHRVRSPVSGQFSASIKGEHRRFRVWRRNHVTRSGVDAATNCAVVFPLHAGPDGAGVPALVHQSVGQYGVADGALRPAGVGACRLLRVQRERLQPRVQSVRRRSLQSTGE
jgi:hypothetical protein